MKNEEQQSNSEFDIHIGKATVCFDSKKLLWVKPGGEFIFTEKRAREYCQKLADFMAEPKKAA